MSDPLELQFQVVVVSDHVGARDSAYLGPLEEQSGLLTTELSVWSPHHFLTTLKPETTLNIFNNA